MDNFPVLLEVYFSNEIETELKKYTFQYRGPLNVADVCIFCTKISGFWQQHLHSKQWCESCAKRYFSSVFSFSMIEGSIKWKYRFYSLWSEFSFWIAPNWPKIEKIAMTSEFSGMTSSSTFLTLFCFFSYWFKFHINITTGSGIMTISFYKGLTKNLKIWNNHVWVLSNIWSLGQVRNTRFNKNVSNKMLLNARKCQGCSLCRFLFIKRKPTGGKITPTSSRLGLKVTAKSALSFCSSFHPTKWET